MSLIELVHMQPRYELGGGGCQQTSPLASLSLMPFSPRLVPTCCKGGAATRESAFVHAIASAGVAFAVTRACADGSATICGCDTRHKGPPGDGWKWGGCSEDVEFGSMVSREFADARENRRTPAQR
ncbi:hypothetical protein OJAV_G00176180 [Oryzias javanicus]|uniref:Protein Wnt n=1 Tax=Oryzias javanicus TaxID=123683 RepID=A0A437CFU0_ORYJA|nr:hypothetical protein OJAV_G00176180 [Oryzias javanicus]